MTAISANHGRVAANDNPLWSWRGTCTACGADMGPVRDSSYCLDCLHSLTGPNAETVNTTDIPDDLRRIGIVGLYQSTPCKLIVANPSGDDVA